MKAKVAKNFSENLDWLSEQPMDYRIAMIQQHLSLCQLLVNQIVTSSLIEYVGEKGSHQKPHGGEYSRYGYNPGSVRIGDQKVPVQVQRIKNNVTGETFKPEIYDQIKENTAGEERVRLAMLSGLSTRDYDKVMDLTSEAFGLSKSSLSKRFIEQTTRTLEEFQQRKYHSHNFVALQIDGISLGEQMMIICIGITDRGNKIPLDFVQSATENHRPVKDMLLAVKARGLKVTDGILCVIDGSKGIHKAITESFGSKVIIQRCVWHKRENVLSYLSEKDQDWFKGEYADALKIKNYHRAKSSLQLLMKNLKVKNIAAANSLSEGLEELLTLHKLSLVANDESILKLSRSLSTTNCIENINSAIRRKCGRITRWVNSDQRHRWLAGALLEIETGLNKIQHWKKLPVLKKAITSYMKRPSITLKSGS
jgi:transposase-like protein